EKIKLAPEDSRMAKQEPRVPVHGDPGHWIHISESPRNVRIVLGGKTLADSKHVKLLREDGILPVYYFPASDVRTDLMVPSGKKTECLYKGEASYWSLKAGNKTADNAAWSYINPLLEANHPVRYYIPQEDVRMDFLVPSAAQSRCPYKGPASYWSVKIGDQIFADMIWSYKEPIPECPKIKGLLCFFHERGAEIYVDGEKIPPPKTKWARELNK